MLISLSLECSKRHLTPRLFSTVLWVTAPSWAAVRCRHRGPPGTRGVPIDAAGPWLREKVRTSNGRGLLCLGHRRASDVSNIRVGVGHQGWTGRGPWPGLPPIRRGVWLEIAGWAKGQAGGCPGTGGCGAFPAWVTRHFSSGWGAFAASPRPCAGGDASR